MWVLNLREAFFLKEASLLGRLPRCSFFCSKRRPTKGNYAPLESYARKNLYAIVKRRSLPLKSSEQENSQLLLCPSKRQQGLFNRLP